MVTNAVVGVVAEATEQAAKMNWSWFWGFLLAIAVFVLQEWLRNIFKNQALVNALKYELDYNINEYNEWIQCEQRNAEGSPDGVKRIFLPRERSHFADLFYNSGLAPLYLSTELLGKWLDDKHESALCETSLSRAIEVYETARSVREKLDTPVWQAVIKSNFGW